MTSDQGALCAAPPPPDCGEQRLLARLSAGLRLSGEEARIIRDMCKLIGRVAAREDIVTEGQAGDHVHVLLDGWAARYKILPNGTREIVGLLIPGDVRDLPITVFGEMDHSIVALTTARIGYVSRSVIKDLHLKRASLGTGLWRYTMIGEAILRSWVVNLGRRDAAERIAHLLCELRDRLRLAGLVRGHRFALPLTQEVMADALGLTSAHVNRVLQRLRARGFIILQSGEVTILDREGLSALAGFDPAYLH